MYQWLSLLWLDLSELIYDGIRCTLSAIMMFMANGVSHICRKVAGLNWCIFLPIGSIGWLYILTYGVTQEKMKNNDFFNANHNF